MPLTRGRLVPLTAGLAAISTDSLYGGCLGLPLAARSPGELPQNVFRYILEASWLHQLLLLVLAVAIFLLEVVPRDWSATERGSRSPLRPV